MSSIKELSLINLRIVTEINCAGCGESRKITHNNSTDGEKLVDELEKTVLEEGWINGTIKSNLKEVTVILCSNCHHYQDTSV